MKDKDPTLKTAETKPHGAAHWQAVLLPAVKKNADLISGAFLNWTEFSRVLEASRCPAYAAATIRQRFRHIRKDFIVVDGGFAERYHNWVKLTKNEAFPNFHRSTTSVGVGLKVALGARYDEFLVTLSPEARDLAIPARRRGRHAMVMLDVIASERLRKLAHENGVKPTLLGRAILGAALFALEQQMPAAAFKAHIHAGTNP